MARYHLSSENQFRAPKIERTRSKNQIKMHIYMSRICIIIEKHLDITDGMPLVQAIYFIFHKYHSISNIMCIMLSLSHNALLTMSQNPTTKFPNKSAADKVLWNTPISAESRPRHLTDLQYIFFQCELSGFLEKDFTQRSRGKTPGPICMNNLTCLSALTF